MFKVVFFSLFMLIFIGGMFFVLMYNFMLNVMIVENMVVMWGVVNKFK